jgi:tRNA A-37 threonylcarbamoyl transferase component Bud32
MNHSIDQALLKALQALKDGDKLYSQNRPNKHLSNDHGNTLNLNHSITKVASDKNGNIMYFMRQGENSKVNPTRKGGSNKSTQGDFITVNKFGYIIKREHNKILRQQHVFADNTQAKKNTLKAENDAVGKFYKKPIQNFIKHDAHGKTRVASIQDDLGESLYDIIKVGHKIDIQTGLDAIDYALINMHQQGVIHNDIKPRNLTLTMQNRQMIINVIDLPDPTVDTMAVTLLFAHSWDSTKINDYYAFFLTECLFVKGGVRYKENAPYREIIDSIYRNTQQAFLMLSYESDGATNIQAAHSIYLSAQQALRAGRENSQDCVIQTRIQQYHRSSDPFIACFKTMEEQYHSICQAWGIAQPLPINEFLGRSPQMMKDYASSDSHYMRTQTQTMITQLMQQSSFPTIQTFASSQYMRSFLAISQQQQINCLTSFVQNSQVNKHTPKAFETYYQQYVHARSQQQKPARSVNILIQRSSKVSTSKLLLSEVTNSAKLDVSASTANHAWLELSCMQQIRRFGLNILTFGITCFIQYIRNGQQGIVPASQAISETTFLGLMIVNLLTAGIATVMFGIAINVRVAYANSNVKRNEVTSLSCR